MSEPIAVPVAAARRIDDIIRRRGALEVELQQAVDLVLATLGAPDGWQIRIETTGAMVAVAPPSTTPED